MIDAAIVRRMQTKKADELHMQLCAEIEQTIIINAAMGSFNELRVQLQSENQSTIQSTIQHSYILSIPLEAYDIERLRFVLETAGYEFHRTAYNNNFIIIKW
mgnify:CR=1 FL=1